MRKMRNPKIETRNSNVQNTRAYSASLTRMHGWEYTNDRYLRSVNLMVPHVFLVDVPGVVPI
jgi:hypothetical protein